MKRRFDGQCAGFRFSKVAVELVPNGATATRPPNGLVPCGATIFAPAPASVMPASKPRAWSGKVRSGFPSRQTQSVCAEIMLKQKARARWRFNLIPSRSRRATDAFRTSRSARQQIRLRQIKHLVAAAAHHGAKHPQAEALDLLRRDGGRHR